MAAAAQDDSRPAPGSFEGFLFTSLPPKIQLLGLPEVVVQTAAFSFLLSWWCQQPARWLNVIAAVSIGLVVRMSTMGALAALGVLKAA